MKGPSPVPRGDENALVVKKGSKIGGIFSGAIPQPQSWTATATYSEALAGCKTRSTGVCSSRRVAISMLLRPFIDSAALKTKFKRICWIKSFGQAREGRAGDGRKVTWTSRK